MLLLLIYAGFIAGSGSTRGLLGLPSRRRLERAGGDAAGRGVVRAFALPLLLVAHRLPDAGAASHPTTSMLGGYRKLWKDIAAEWRRDRNLVYYLIASAVFRDGLAAMFAFGAVLGVNVYGISQADVLIFGVAASMVAALGAVVGGFVDDRIGSKPVIVGSLVVMIGVVLGVDGAVTVRARSGCADCWGACSSGRRSRRRARCCCAWPHRARKVWLSACTR